MIQSIDKEKFKQFLKDFWETDLNVAKKVLDYKDIIPEFEKFTQQYFNLKKDKSTRFAFHIIFPFIKIEDKELYELQKKYIVNFINNSFNEYVKEDHEQFKTIRKIINFYLENLDQYLNDRGTGNYEIQFSRPDGNVNFNSRHPHVSLFNTYLELDEETLKRVEKEEIKFTSLYHRIDIKLENKDYDNQNLSIYDDILKNLRNYNGRYEISFPVVADYGMGELDPIINEENAKKLINEFKKILNDERYVFFGKDLIFSYYGYRLEYEYDNEGNIAEEYERETDKVPIAKYLINTLEIDPDKIAEIFGEEYGNVFEESYDGLKFFLDPIIEDMKKFDIYKEFPVEVKLISYEGTTLLDVQHKEELLKMVISSESNTILIENFNENSIRYDMDYYVREIMNDYDFKLGITIC